MPHRKADSLFSSFFQSLPRLPKTRHSDILPFPLALSADLSVSLSLFLTREVQRQVRDCLCAAPYAETFVVGEEMVRALDAGVIDKNSAQTADERGFSQRRRARRANKPKTVAYLASAINPLIALAM